MSAQTDFPFIVLVFGGRDFNDRVLMHETMTALRQRHNPTMLMHGGARGADELAGQWARNIGMQEIVVPANWKFYKNAAGPIRNTAMRNLQPSLAVAFPGGKGTADMKAKIMAAGIRLVEVYGHMKPSTSGAKIPTLIKAKANRARARNR